MNCTYDNPETNIREYWVDGEPAYAESKATIGHLSHILEPWINGRIVGNPAAMSNEDTLPTFHSKLKGLIKKYRSSGGDNKKLVEYIDSQLKAYDAIEKNKEKIIEKLLTDAREAMMKSMAETMKKTWEDIFAKPAIRDMSDAEIEEWFDDHGNTVIRLKEDKK